MWAPVNILDSRALLSKDIGYDVGSIFCPLLKAFHRIHVLWVCEELIVAHITGLVWALAQHAPGIVGLSL